MPNINITVKNKIAEAECGAKIVCKNTDYDAVFTFDEEWDSHLVKTVRFAYDEKNVIPVTMVGNSCNIPKLPNTYLLGIEVQAGNLKTAVPAWVECLPVLDDEYGEIEPPQPSIYEQIMQLINSGVLTGAKIVDTVYIGKDEKGGNVYKQIFDNGTENYFTAPKGADANLIIGEESGNAYDGAKGAKNASDILVILQEIAEVYKAIRQNSENISAKDAETAKILGEKLDKSSIIANGNLIKYNSETQSIEDSGISVKNVDDNANGIKENKAELNRQSLAISQNSTKIARAEVKIEQNSAKASQNANDIKAVARRLNTIADSDDISLDQLSEIVAYIRSNRDVIDAITTLKVSVSDIVDSLESTSTKNPLSANQGRVLDEKISETEITLQERTSNWYPHYSKISVIENHSISGQVDTIEIPRDYIPNDGEHFEIIRDGVSYYCQLVLTESNGDMLLVPDIFLPLENMQNSWVIYFVIDKSQLVFLQVDGGTHTYYINQIEYVKLPEQYLPKPDDVLNTESERPVQNKVVTQAIGDISSALDELHAYAQNLIGGN